ncbi:MAG: class I SAM-dependent methyltransferase [Gemmatimonadetes bacterium]|nr:class I SAM-dependent methyltransferase [Gemmatimonadota bacterium]
MSSFSRRLPRRLEAAFWSFHSLTWDGGVSPAAAAARAARITGWVGTHCVPGASVLDLGCATGVHTLALAAAGFRATGVDFAPGMLRRARARAASVGPLPHLPEFLRADLNRPLPLPSGGWDAVLCAGVLQCIDDPVRLLRDVHRLLAPGGVVIVEAKDARAPTPPVTGYTPASRLFAPVKAWASRRGRVRPFTREALDAALRAAGLVTIDDRGGAGWLRIAARAA